MGGGGQKLRRHSLWTAPNRAKTYQGRGCPPTANDLNGKWRLSRIPGQPKKERKDTLSLWICTLKKYFEGDTWDFYRLPPWKKNPGFQNLSFYQGGDPKKQGLQNLEIFPEFEINLDLSNQTSEYRLKSRLTTTVDKGGTLGALIWITFIAKLYPQLTPITGTLGIIFENKVYQKLKLSKCQYQKCEHTALLAYALCSEATLIAWWFDPKFGRKCMEELLVLLILLVQPIRMLVWIESAWNLPMWEGLA